MFGEKAPKIKLQAGPQKAGGLFPGEQLLFSVERGLGRLGVVSWRDEEKDCRTPCALMLGEVPLALCRSAACPTCTSLLAEGHGRSAGDPALRVAADRMNAPYAGLADAMERLSPLLGLLHSGAWMLSRRDCVPTDGEGRFFWDTPPVPEDYQATAFLYDFDGLRCLPPCACFLYPSQSPEGLDESRVEYYREKLRTGEELPPALGYILPSAVDSGGMAVVLDGHHRACACALEGRAVPCLLVSQPTVLSLKGKPYVLWPDGETSPLAERVDAVYWARRDTPPACLREGRPWVRRSWPEEYKKSVEHWPTAEEAAWLSLYPETELTEAGIRRLAQIMGPEYAPETVAAAVLLQYAARQPGCDAKRLGFSFAGGGEHPDLREAACRVLDRIRDDPETDEFFIQILVDEPRDSALWRIADGHWNT